MRQAKKLTTWHLLGKSHSLAGADCLHCSPCPKGQYRYENAMISVTIFTAPLSFSSHLSLEISSESATKSRVAYKLSCQVSLVTLSRIGQQWAMPWDWRPQVLEASEQHPHWKPGGKLEIPRGTSGGYRDPAAQFTWCTCVPTCLVCMLIAYLNLHECSPLIVCTKVLGNQMVCILTERIFWEENERGEEERKCLARWALNAEMKLGWLELPQLSLFIFYFF